MNFLRRGDFKLFSDFVSVTAELCKLFVEQISLFYGKPPFYLRRKPEPSLMQN